MNLNDEQIDALTESINIGVGRAAASLGQLIGERIELAVPSIKTCTLAELSGLTDSSQEVLDTLVTQDFTGIANGRALLGFSRSSGIKLAQILGADGGGGDDPDLDLDLCGILEEVGNLVLNGVLGSLANMMSTTLTYTVPVLHTDSVINDALAKRAPEVEGDEGPILLADAHFGVARRKIHGSLIIAFELNGIETVLKSILGQGVAS